VAAYENTPGFRPEQFTTEDSTVIAAFKEALKKSVRVNWAPGAFDPDYNLVFLSTPDPGGSGRILGQYYLWVNDLDRKGHLIESRGKVAYEIPEEVTVKLQEVIARNFLASGVFIPEDISSFTVSLWNQDTNELLEYPARHSDSIDVLRTAFANARRTQRPIFYGTEDYIVTFYEVESGGESQAVERCHLWFNAVDRKGLITDSEGQTYELNRAATAELIEALENMKPKFVTGTADRNGEGHGFFWGTLSTYMLTYRDKQQLADNIFNAYFINPDLYPCFKRLSPKYIGLESGDFISFSVKISTFTGGPVGGLKYSGTIAIVTDAMRVELQEGEGTYIEMNEAQDARILLSDGTTKDFVVPDEICMSLTQLKTGEKISFQFFTSISGKTIFWFIGRR